ncbi:hypothetical protein HMI54_001267 [Coelomomyces lativittatus]|nr:hypothetical protein HMI56_002018 [Coelomomyces lativittatus]KAJ1504379.1 hypothetical protein HMI55_002034 [Coelomomyces lativittatus]KAJ1510891.1 hypothetical protein HMI54_001267 [Coelomomyces lativittatus]
MSQKRKLNSSSFSEPALKKKPALSKIPTHSNAIDSSPVHLKKSIRPYTISIALPGSIIDNCQNLELKTYVAGQIARAAAIYKVDEIIVFNESHQQMQADPLKDPNVFLAKILLYLECPQYLRKSFFPMHSAFKCVGLLNPLDLPNHVRSEERSKYREGVVVDTLTASSLVNVGLKKLITVDQEIPVHSRVTVDMHQKSVVSRQTPNLEGHYWGYKVRVCNGLHEVFTNATYPYDLKLGTSERGQPLSKMPSFQHLLLVFGGLHGLEAAAEADVQLTTPLDKLFDQYLNVCPFQGVRTIRTEEAVLITLSTLQGYLGAS